MTVLIGMAKPRPTLPASAEEDESVAAEYIAELMPMMLPLASMSAPPELPGFREASVWSALYVVVDVPVSPLNCWPPNWKGQLPSPPWPPWLSLWLSSVETVTSRLSAETMPLVTVPVRPSGEPIATTVSPTLTPSELPRVAAFRPDAFSSLISARSFLLSVPTTLAVYDFPSLVDTLIEVAPEMTWLLVTISPPLVMITPEPVDVPLLSVALTSTTLGLTAAAMVATSPVLLEGTTLVVVDEETTSSLPVSSWMP